MPQLQPSLSNFTQVRFAGALTAITTAQTSDAFTPGYYGSSFPPKVRVLVAIQGATTSTDVTVSIGMSDSANVEAWTAPLIAEIRALPSGDKVASMLTFSTGRAASLRIAVESAVQGAGAKVYYAFEDERS